MSRNTYRTACSAACAALLFAYLSASIPAWGLEAPKPASSEPSAAPQAAPGATIEATDESAFIQTLQRVTHFRAFRGLKVSGDVIDRLARGDAEGTVAALGAAADEGDRDANIALVRVQHWCSSLVSSRSADPQAQIAKLREQLPPPRAARVAGVIRADSEFRNRARTSCTRAQFDYGAIEARLRQAADAGDPASAATLAPFLRDPAKRDELLQAAAAKNYAPALYAQATNLLIAVQRGQTTQNVGSIRELLKQAGRSIPQAKVDLANCMAYGCDGHPADALTAHAFGMDAARDGEPSAFLSMVRMPWGGRLTRTQMLAWQYFGDRLNESGCMGDTYVPNAVVFAQSVRMLEKGQDAGTVETARSQADTLWRDYGQRAMSENGCK